MKKGFTLIELLVILAIVSLLSSIILANLKTSRDRGANAAIRANINTIRTQSEIVYDETVKVANQFVSESRGRERCNENGFTCTENLPTIS